MKSDRELLEQALEYIPDGMKLYDDFRAEIRVRLAEDDDEPVAWITGSGDIFRQYESASVVETGKPCPLYRRPAPARKPLSKDEIDKAYDDMCHVDRRLLFLSDFRKGVRWAEKAHGIGEENAL